MQKRVAVAFTGPSNSGKTTLIVKVAKSLIEEHNKKVCIIKNDPKDKAQLDREGKDSFKFTQTGADVAIASPTRTTYFLQQSQQLEDMINTFGDFDYLLVEGLKTLPLPRIAIFRDSVKPEYFDASDAYAVDHSINKNELPSNVDILDLNDHHDVISWINSNGKEV